MAADVVAPIGSRIRAGRRGCALDLAQASRKCGDRWEPVAGCLAQRSGEGLFDIGPRLHAPCRERENGALADRAQERPLLELEILIVLAGEQDIQQRGECKLLPCRGCRRRREARERRIGKLRLEIERHAGARHVVAIGADPPREREVEHRDSPIAIHQDVARMDVAVYDALGVESSVAIEERDPEAEERRAPLVGRECAQFDGHAIDIGPGAPVEHEKRRFADRAAPTKPRADAAVEMLEHVRFMRDPLRVCGLGRTTRRFERVPLSGVIGGLPHFGVIERLHATHDGPVLDPRAGREPRRGAVVRRVVLGDEQPVVHELGDERPRVHQERLGVGAGGVAVLDHGVGHRARNAEAR